MEWGKIPSKVQRPDPGYRSVVVAFYSSGALGMLDMVAVCHLQFLRQHASELQWSNDRRKGYIFLLLVDSPEQLCHCGQESAGLV